MSVEMGLSAQAMANRVGIKRGDRITGQKLHKARESMLKRDLRQGLLFNIPKIELGLPRWLSGKESARQAGDMGLIPGLGRSAGKRNSNPFQDSCLETPRDTGTWEARVHGIAKSWA